MVAAAQCLVVVGQCFVAAAKMFGGCNKITYLTFRDDSKNMTSSFHVIKNLISFLEPFTIIFSFFIIDQKILTLKLIKQSHS